jgi:Flp pilus assembly protein TadG
MKRLACRAKPSGSRESERGFSTVELVIGVPAILVIFMLLHLGWVVTQSHADVDFAARSAARAASMAQTKDGAQTAANEAATSVIADRSTPCSRVDIRVIDSDTDMKPGGLVTVRVRCTADFSKVTALGVVGSKTYEHISVAVIDRLRGG